jgi:hypothetical protein
MEEAHDALLLAREAGEHCKGHLVADILVALQLLRAGWRGAYHIASANLRMAATLPTWKADVTMPGELCARAENLFAATEAAILARLKGD